MITILLMYKHFAETLYDLLSGNVWYFTFPHRLEHSTSIFIQTSKWEEEFAKQRQRLFKQRANSEDEERSARSDQTSQSFNDSKLNGYILTSKYKVSHVCWRRVLRKTNGTKLSHHFAIVSNQIRRSVDLDDLLSDTLMLLRKKSLSTTASIECTSQKASSYSNGQNIK